MRVVSGVAILDLNGPLVIGPPAAAMREAVRAALDRGQRNILLNLADVPHCDSAGMGEMVSAYSAALRRGGSVKLAGVGRRVMEMIRMTRLDLLLDICADETAALAAFAAVQPKSLKSE
jgi:anti-sigma B factor antagonist